MVAFYPQLPALPPVASGAPTLDVVHHCDAVTLMRFLPAGCIDGIIGDPPYDMTELDFEQVIEWAAFWKEARRILSRRDSPVILFSQQPFTTDLISSNRKGWRYEIIYEKTMPVGFLDANRRPLRCHENIQVFADGMPDYYPQMDNTDDRKFRGRSGGAEHYNNHERHDGEDDGLRYPRSVWKFAQRNTAFKNTKTLHPTEKPLPLMERLVLTYTRAGEVILDPFCGSGSTLVAARNNGRRYIGGDIGLHWVRKSRQRLQQPFMLSMFDQIEKPPAPKQAELFAMPG
jgi:site-specific DNA-methyltransferase (adenine-specific)